MRILFSSMPAAGHFGPMVPFVRASVRGGHRAMVAGTPPLARAAEETGALFWPVDEPDAVQVASAVDGLRGLSHADANAWMVGQIFARLRSGAAIPRLREAIRSFRPDLVVRETAEFGAAVAAEIHQLPHTRIAIGLNATEELIFRIAAGPVDELRRAVGLSADPDGFRLREARVLTLFPASLDDPALPVPTGTVRYRDPAWARAAAGAGAGPRPFVYITFGTEAAKMPAYASVYREVVRAVEHLDADVLITLGREADPGMLGAPPPHVRVERWIDQATVLGRAAAVICHGGGGSTLGAIAAGAPLVVAPLFAEDQHINARRVAAVGAGLVAGPDAESIRTALRLVLTEPSFRAAAFRLARELHRHTSTDDFPRGLLDQRSTQR
jgi:UDP:flavonoid glycosyltransferase YjiC (YdhE family)